MDQYEAAHPDWTHQTLGKVARVALAAGGMSAAFLFLLLAGSVGTGVWALVVGGVALAATSVRAAWLPSRTRLLVMAANLAAIPLFAQVL